MYINLSDIFNVGTYFLSLQYCYLTKGAGYFLHRCRQYLSLPEQTSDLHSVQMPAWVDPTVVMANTDLLNYIPHVC